MSLQLEFALQINNSHYFLTAWKAYNLLFIRRFRIFYLWRSL